MTLPFRSSRPLPVDRVFAPLLGAALVLASLLVALPSSAAYDQLGGDDVLVQTFGQMPADMYAMDITSTGNIYVAVLDRTVVIDVIRVYLSQDRGTTWRQWGQVSGSGAAPVTLGKPALHVAEGGEDRLFLVYETGVIGAVPVIRVSWSQLGLDNAAWTHVDALSTPGVTFMHPSIHSDQLNSDPYTLHLVASGDDGDGQDIWYARSTDAGATWSAGYRCAPAPNNTTYYIYPSVRYGFGNVVHVAWRSFQVHGDDGIHYRRALSGAAAPANWQPQVEIASSTNGINDVAPSVAPSNGSTKVLLSFQRGDPIDALDSEVRLSTDGGATWPTTTGARARLAGMTYPGVLALPGTGGFVCMAQLMAENYGLMRSTDAAPLTFTLFQSLMDRSYKDGSEFGPSDAMDFDVTRANRIGAVWTREGRLSTDRDSVWYDAESRTDLGYALFEPGMPVELPSEPSSHPAICELDGDPQSEIVWGDSLGYIRAYNHDGTPVAGWPQAVSDTMLPSPVAVGDLDGDGCMEVVVGDMQGRVHAYHCDGTPLANFPRDLGLTTSVRVVIGSLISATPRQLVVNFLNNVGVMLPNGAWAPGWPVSKSSTFSGGCAVGDVDDDGVNEVVSLYGPYMGINKPNGTLLAQRSIVSTGHTFRRVPTLADLDLDGDLEILAFRDDGSLYAMHHFGADLPNWPWIRTGRFGAPQPTVAEFLGGGGPPEILASIRGIDEDSIYVFSPSGGGYGGWPQSAGRSDEPLPVIVDRWSSITSVFGKWRNDHAMGRKNIGNPLDGMPKRLPGYIGHAPCSGDVDADNKFEVVYLTNSPPTLSVMQINSYVDHTSYAPTGWWPMYGYNHERQSCLACGVDAVTEAPGPGLPTAVRFEAPGPNPSSGPLTFRFALPRDAAVHLDLFDVSGRAVRRLLKAERPAGAHEVTWDGLGADGSPVPAGVYHARLEITGAGVVLRRVVRTN